MLFLRPRLVRSMSLHHFAKSDAKFCLEGCGLPYLFTSTQVSKTLVQALCSPEEPMSTAKLRRTWAGAAETQSSPKGCCKAASQSQGTWKAATILNLRRVLKFSHDVSNMGRFLRWLSQHLPEKKTKTSAIQMLHFKPYFSKFYVCLRGNPLSSFLGALCQIDGSRVRAFTRWTSNLVA